MIILVFLKDIPQKETYRVWIRDEVPILLKDITVEGEVVSCFVTVKLCLITVPAEMDGQI